MRARIQKGHMRLPTTEPLTFNYRGREVTIPAKEPYTHDRDQWGGSGFSVIRYFSTGQWLVSISGPWYDDSDPCKSAPTLGEAITLLETEVEEWIKALNGGTDASPHPV
jgi:hypothetical protein